MGSYQDYVLIFYAEGSNIEIKLMHAASMLFALKEGGVRQKGLVVVSQVFTTGLAFHQSDEERVEILRDSRLLPTRLRISNRRKITPTLGCVTVSGKARQLGTRIKIIITITYRQELRLSLLLFLFPRHLNREARGQFDARLALTSEQSL